MKSGGNAERYKEGNEPETEGGKNFDSIGTSSDKITPPLSLPTFTSSVFQARNVSPSFQAHSYSLMQEAGSSDLSGQSVDLPPTTHAGIPQSSESSNLSGQSVDLPPTTHAGIPQSLGSTNLAGQSVDLPPTTHAEILQ